MFAMCLTTMRKWRVLCWNVRGLNSENRQRVVRAKIEESECAIVCLQETKCDLFGERFIIKFCPERFDNFAYAPSVRASGGILILWNSSIFSGRLIDTKSFGIIMEFTFVHNNATWNLVNVYGPCKWVERDNFVSWL